MGRAKTEIHKQKISEGVKRYYENETPEKRAERIKNLSEYRQRETKVYRYIKRHIGVLKRVVEEVNREKKDNDPNKGE